MRKTYTEKLLLAATALGISLFSATAGAQITGELVEPDVMLIIDSSLSMDWAEGAPPGSSQNEWSRDQCELSNTAGVPFERTSWQKMLDVFLGGIDGDGRRCSVEPTQLRPSLHAIDSVFLPDVLNDEDPANNVPDNISEFRNVAWPHYRAVNCPNYWTKNDGSDFYQCIDTSGSPDCNPATDPGCPADYLAEEVSINKLGNIYCQNRHVYTEDGNTYCLDYHPSRENRQSNGILDRYESSARFGIMTYDNTPTCLGTGCDDHDRLWDYGPYRQWNCLGEGETDQHLCYQWNAGARGSYTGAVGGMVGISSNIEQSNRDVRNTFETMEPLYCSPMASLIDDVGHYFRTDSEVLPADSTTSLSGNDQYYSCRPKVTILISDGQPTSAFEFTAGGCSGTEAQWTDTDTTMDTDTATDGEWVADCPWKSSPEEAAEIFDVGIDALTQMNSGFDPATDIPLFLVVIGFNVPDVDCAVTPEDCYEYTSTYYNTMHCYEDLPPCGGGGSDAGVDGGAAPGTDAGTEEICLMNPRQFLNEVACQGWPNDPARTVGDHITDIRPPWLADDADICAPSGFSGDPDEYICLENERALFVNNPTKLAKALDLVLGNLSSSAATRTDLVTWNVPLDSAADDIAQQYEFRTGYIARNGRPWQGILTRKDWNCVLGNVDDPATNLQDVTTGMEDQASSGTRTIYSIDPVGDQLDLSDYSGVIDPSNMSGWLNQASNTDLNLQELGDTYDDCDFGVGDDVGSECDGKRIVAPEVEDYILGRGLADIFNSTPAILGAPSGLLPDQSYRTYRSDNRGRNPHLFVGTNDGVIHAFDIKKMESAPSNVESWGFIPRSALKQVRLQYPIPDIIMDYLPGPPPVVSGYHLADEREGGLYQHLYLADGSPVAKDVLLVRDPANDSAEAADQWRAVVFGGLGKGARGYYALDVTKNLIDPAIPPRLRWEIAPDDNLFGANDPDDSDVAAAFNKMGYPISRPGLAYVSVTEGVKTLNLAAAILPGGWNSDSTPSGNTGVYIVRLGDGQLLKYLDPGQDYCGGAPELYTEDDILRESAQLIGEPVVLNSTIGTELAKEILIGDDRGRIWLVDVSETNPDEWCLQLYFDTLITWHYPYEDCVPRDDADSDNDPVLSTVPGFTTCAPNVPPAGNCYYDDCCVGPPNGATAAKCGPDPKSPRNMNGPRVLLLGKPTIALDEWRRPVILFGTGQYDGLSKWNRNRIFSITDEIEADLSGDLKHKARINWWIGDDVVDVSFTGLNISYAQLLQSTSDSMDDTHVDWGGVIGPGNGTLPDYFWNVGEKMIGVPWVFDKVAYFTTFVPIESPGLSRDACNSGTSRIWALVYNYDKTSDVINFDDPTNCQFGWFVDDATGDRKMYREYPGDLLSGTQIVRRPDCENAGEDVFEIVVQRINPTTELPGEGSTAGANELVVSKQFKINKGASRDIARVYFDSWSLIFE